MSNNQIEFPTQLDLEEKISHWAHDLRSPFNHVLGFTKMVLNEMSGPLTDLQKEDLTTAYNSNMRAMSLVNNLIEIARLKRGEKDICQTPIELQIFIDKTIELWKKNNPEVELPVAVLITTHSPIFELDEKQTGSILKGFFSYLAAYSEDSGKLTVEISEETDKLVFTLHQTGITKKGYDEMSMEMFAYICKSYIELQKGEIHQRDLGENEAKIQFALPKIIHNH